MQLGPMIVKIRKGINTRRFCTKIQCNETNRFKLGKWKKLSRLINIGKN